MPDPTSTPVRTYRLPRALAWLVYQLLDRMCVEHATGSVPAFGYDDTPGQVVIRIEEHA